MLTWLFFGWLMFNVGFIVGAWWKGGEDEALDNHRDMWRNLGAGRDGVRCVESVPAVKEGSVRRRPHIHVVRKTV